jgi:hypothetical protein
MVHVALRYGERPEVAYVLPISVDGMLIVASAAMVEDKRHGHRVRWSARVAFVAGVAASVAANIAAAQATVGARIVAAWPAVAMLLVVEMLARARPPADTPATVTSDDAADKERSSSTPSAPGTSGESRNTPTGALPAAAAASDPHTEGDLSVQASRGDRLRRTGKTADVIARMLAERPDARPADIAAEAGVSERHVRHLSTSGSGPSVTGSDLKVGR